MTPNRPSVFLDVNLYSKPDAVFRTVAAHFPDAQLLSASVTPQLRRFFSDGVYLSRITPTEMKEADIALGAAAHMLSAAQIAEAETLNRVLFHGLSGRSPMPTSYPHDAGLKISIHLRSPCPAAAEALQALPKAGVISLAKVVIRYRNSPSEPLLERNMISVRDGRTQPGLDDLALIQKWLDADTKALARQSIEQVALFYRKQTRVRVDHVFSLARKRLGDKAAEWMAEKDHQGRTRAEQMWEDWIYDDTVRRL